MHEVDDAITQSSTSTSRKRNTVDSPLLSPLSLEDARNRKKQNKNDTHSTIKHKFDFSSQYVLTANAKMDFEKERLEYQKSADSARISLEREKMELEKKCKEKAMELEKECKKKAMEMKAQEVKVLFVQNMLSLGKTAQEIKDAMELAGLK